MKAFWRVFEYIWPQWPRLIVIFISVVLISTLFSLSFMTIAPLLKVMMGQEGLHGWVDRKICSYRYGLKFYMPDRADFSDPNKVGIAFYLTVTGVKEDSLADKAGLRSRDDIIGADDALVVPPTKSEQDASRRPVLNREKVTSSELLEVLATAPDKTELPVQYMRLDDEGNMEYHQINLYTGRQLFYIGWLQGLMSFLPREQTPAAKTEAITLIILLMAVFTVIRCTARFFQQYLAEKVAETAVAKLRQQAFSHVVDMPITYFEVENPSDAVSRLIRDTKQFSIGIHTLLGKTLREPLTAVALLVGAMIIDVKLTLIFVCSAPAVVALIAVLGKKIKRATRKTLMGWSLMLGKLSEAFDSIKVIKVYNQQEYENKNFDRINKGLLKQMLRIAKIDAVTSPIMDVLGMIAGGAALLFGAHWVARQQIDASEFIALVAILGTAAESIRKSSDVWNKIQQANAGAERVYGIIDREIEPESPNAYELIPLKNKIEFKDVIFTYPGSEMPVLKGVNLTVEAGHNIAIVGPNGSGKTTLVNLVPRFHDPDSGQILIDGQNIRDATLFSLRSQISMVTQNVVTFNDTVAANIAYSKPGATKEEIIDAAKRSYIHEFVEPLPKGYDTMIGEQGTGFSGGQLQRIVIARAILKNPSILIFDEATSQVDAESEAKIHKAIEEIMRGRTSFIIAHRFSTVISADLIVVMDDGQIIDQGQHEELMQRCSLYQGLYETQLVKK
jgi:subfamily B ATP-binding cassette protein MsbA